MKLEERLDILEEKIAIINNKKEEEKEICCICLEEMDKNNNLVILTCGHSIDFLCFMGLALNSNSNPSENKCPLCRTPLITKEFYNDIIKKSIDGNMQREIDEREEIVQHQISVNSEYISLLPLVNSSIINPYAIDNLQLDFNFNCDEWILYIMRNYYGGGISLSMDDIYLLLDANLRWDYSIDTIRGAVSRLVRDGSLLKTRSQEIGNGRTFMYQIIQNV